LIATRAQLVRQTGGRAGSDVTLWDDKAAAYSRRFADTARTDPFFEHICRYVTNASSLLDVGCGSGRFTLELAPLVREVVAVDPSGEMLGILQSQVQRRGLENVRLVKGLWEETGVSARDVVICAHVLPLIADAAGFLKKLDERANNYVLLYMSALGSDTPDPFWRYFYGEPLPPSPTYLDALDVLREIGIEPAVEVIELQRSARYQSFEEAVKDYASNLLLHPSDPRYAELRGLLASWLLKERGLWRAPVSALPAAIFTWAP